MEAASCVGASGSVSAFDYNRDNFEFDREMRFKKELAGFKFMIDKAQLWREDIRDVVDLVETRMKHYLLVNVLILSFTMMLWNQGRLSYGTPDWLLIGYSISICCAFMFLCLTVYFALHAAIISKCAGTRLLTQLVRLPVPTFSEIEACRTYLSNFEKVEPQQMFRVPFVSGSQEASAFGPSGCGCASATVDRAAGSVDDDDDDLSVASNESSNEAMPLCTDPWGLELRVDLDSIEEEDVGVGYGADVVKLRHIKLVRQAMEWWETYDAFARMCSSIGVNQLMVAITYYILGYVLVQVLDAAAAGAGVAVLIMLQEVIASLDMVLTTSQHRIIHLVLVTGPLLAWIAAVLSADGTHHGKVIAQILASGASICHGFYVCLLVIFCHVQEQGHAMMPTAFRAVLFMDVFGWIDKRTDERKSADLAHFQELPSGLRHASFFKSKDHLLSSISDVPARSEHLKSYAPWMLNYLDHDVERSPETSACLLRSGDADAHKKVDEARTQCSVVYDNVGRPCPVMPSDFRAQDAYDDMQNVPGAPFIADDVRGGDPPPPGYFDTLSYISPDARTTSNMDRRDQHTIVTGHDHEEPGMLPFYIFKGATYVIMFVWAVAAIYSLLTALNIWRIYDPFPWNIDEFGIPAHNLLAQGAVTVPQMRKLDVAWPYPQISPTSLSCEASGSHFAVMDGLSVFSGQLIQEPDDDNTGKTRSLRQKHSERSFASINFAAVDCPALRGQTVQDVTVVCGEHMQEASHCKVLALHDHGRRIARCSLVDIPKVNGATGANGTKMDVSSMGLHFEGSVASNMDEPDELEDSAVVASTFSGDPACKGCIVVSTPSGQVIQFQPNSKGTDFIPAGVVYENERHKNGLLKLRTTAVRTFDAQHLGLLHARSKTVEVIEAGGGSAMHIIQLPADKAVESFCIAGNHLYVLTRGHSPEIWYTTIPQVLRRPESLQAR